MTINQLYNDNWSNIDRRAIAQICDTLNISVGELFKVTADESEPITSARNEAEVIVLSADTNAFQEPATKEVNQIKSAEMQISYTPEQEATIKAFLASSGCGRSGNPDSSVSVDAVLYGDKK